MSSYRFITISGRIAPLDTILTREYAEGVTREQTLAKAAPELLAALRGLRHVFRECIGHAAFAEFEASNPQVMAADEAIARAVQP